MRLFPLLAFVLSACIPYGVGTTARPTPVGEITSSTTISLVPGAEFDRDYEPNDPAATAASRLPLLDTEVRYGLSELSDLGLRFTSGSGLVLTYKTLLAPVEDARGVAFAVIGGAGFVNLGNHLFGELTFLVSGGEAGRVTPYGGLRAMHVLPISPGAVTDRPTLGGFTGLRLGTHDLGISPEIGVFYDPSALGIRSGNVIVVPTVTLHGRDLLGRLFRY